MSPILPGDLVLADEFNVGLMDQRGGVEGMAFAFASELPVGDVPQLFIDPGHQGIHYIAVSVTEFDQELNGIGLFCHRFEQVENSS
jgi:hypothetical protein